MTKLPTVDDYKAQMAEGNKEAVKYVQAPAAKAHISGVSVIFDFGHGAIERRGKASGNYSQSDVVDEYARRAVDELEIDNVRLHRVETRKPPGCPQADRLKNGPSAFLPVVFSCGYNERPTLHNMSIVEYAGPYEALARRICEGLTEWGRCYVFGHRVAKPRVVESEHGFVSIKPFDLGGPHEAEYLGRLDPLGQSIGRAIGQYLIDRREGRREITSTLKTTPGL